MQIGGLASEQLLNPRTRTYYEDIIRKTKCITYRVDIIKAIHKDLLDKRSTISENDTTILSGEISDCFEKMYSCMEYVAAIFKEVLRERGNLESKFHKLLKKTLKNTDHSSIYADKRIVSFITRALDWYAIVHDIRSEETHYSMGRIEIVDSKIFYKIKRQTGRETVYDLVRIIKRLPERQDTEYILELEDVTKIYLGFIGSIRQLEEIILSMIV